MSAAKRRAGKAAAENEMKDLVGIFYNLASDPHCGIKVRITQAKLDRDFAKIKSLGFNTITLWPGVALRKRSEAERLTKLAIGKAEEHGLACYIMFWLAGKPHMYSHPFWKKSSPPFVDADGKVVNYMNLWDERWRDGFLRDYLHYVGETFSKFPNLEGYFIDEPTGCGWKWKEYGYDEQTQAQFVAWLKKKYKTLAALKAAWGTKYRSWDQASAPRVEPSASELGNRRSGVGRCWRDWTAARAEFFVDWFADMKRGLTEAHPGCRIIWSITSRYVDNSREHELADCLDWKRIARHIDIMHMAKFPGKDAQAVQFAKDVMNGLARKPEMKGVPKIFAPIIWQCSWLEKTRPGTLREMLRLARAKGFGVDVWAWEGEDHLEAWPDLQKVFKQFAKP